MLTEIRTSKLRMPMGEGYRSFHRMHLYFHLHLMQMLKICKVRITHFLPSLEQLKILLPPVNRPRVTCSMLGVLGELRMIMGVRVRAAEVEFGTSRYHLELFRVSVSGEYGILGTFTD